MLTFLHIMAASVTENRFTVSESEEDHQSWRAGVQHSLMIFLRYSAVNGQV